MVDSGIPISTTAILKKIMRQIGVWNIIRLKSRRVLEPSYLHVFEIVITPTKPCPWGTRTNSHRLLGICQCQCRLGLHPLGLIQSWTRLLLHTCKLNKERQKKKSLSLLLQPRSLFEAACPFLFLPPGKA